MRGGGKGVWGECEHVSVCACGHVNEGLDICTHMRTRAHARLCSRECSLFLIIRDGRGGLGLVAAEEIDFAKEFILLRVDQLARDGFEDGEKNDNDLNPRARITQELGKANARCMPGEIANVLDTVIDRDAQRFDERAGRQGRAGFDVMAQRVIERVEREPFDAC